MDLLGWGVTTGEWLDPAKAIKPVSPDYKSLPPLGSLFATYVFLLVVLGVGAKVLGTDMRRFLTGFTVIFAVSYLCIWLGNNAYIAATPNKVGPKPGQFNIPWSLGLTGEAGYLLALAVGLVVGNFVPGLAGWLARRPGRSGTSRRPS